tara:strand:+ start:2298 stop:2519 length:222 start_codon:yes stop_codon:yes gene_type:complete
MTKKSGPYCVARWIGRDSLTYVWYPQKTCERYGWLIPIFSDLKRVEAKKQAIALNTLVGSSLNSKTFSKVNSV